MAATEPGPGDPGDASGTVAVTVKRALQRSRGLVTPVTRMTAYRYGWEVGLQRSRGLVTPVTVSLSENSRASFSLQRSRGLVTPVTESMSTSAALQ